MLPIANLTTVAPVDLHGLPGLVLHFLVNTAASRSDFAEIDPDQCQLATVTIGATANLFQNTRGRKLWITRQQRIDLWLVRVEQTASWSTSLFIRRMIHAERLRDSPEATPQALGDGAP